MTTRAERRLRPALLQSPDEAQHFSEYAVRCNECRHASDKAKGKERMVIWCLAFRRQYSSALQRTCPKFERK